MESLEIKSISGKRPEAKRVTNERMVLMDRIIALVEKERLPNCLAVLVACHSFVETVGFTSGLLENNRNAFSYRNQQGNYLQLVQDSKEWFAKYSCLSSSVKEVCNLIKRLHGDGDFPLNFKVYTADQYVLLLEHKFAFKGRYNDYVNRMGDVLVEYNYRKGAR